MSNVPFKPSGNAEHDLKRQRAMRVMELLESMGVTPDEGAEICLYVAACVALTDPVDE